MKEVEKEPTEEPPISVTTTTQQQSSKPSTKSQKSKSPKTKSNTPTSASTIRDFYQKNFVFTKKRYTTGPDRVVTPQTRWKVSAACYSMWYPSRSREGYYDLHKENAASLFANVDRYSLEKWMFSTTNIEKNHFLEDCYNKFYKHSVETQE